ncbi:ligase-associated DNA damage response exonuclease [Paenimyroides aestuarii]|uniref:Ligase-associated DNA damage response exonuclease n=1 Tax=Paenimyroides aestuarii TaxID=2968490 RepID=A0ABY5NPB5_9FLAO|nr:ligase-associated DNA damage response exonuclease [Paenimyroides aestuarii]UUV20391.1 ligase-associated DNA damage response exonuclease [Paenimyroides aestuarii]
MRLLNFTENGIYCIPGNFYIDPWKPVDYALITHAHADHARWGMKRYLCHHFTVPILHSRIGKDIQVQGIAYNESLTINGVKVSLHPAGHIIGSAQIRMEYKGKIAVVSGDYKLQNDGLSIPFEPVKCHEFVTESTFGLPIYKWSSVEQLNQLMRDWVIANQKNGKTSVFVGYSLGKAQRILKAVSGVAPLFTHYSIAKLNEAYKSVGVNLPDYQIVDFRESVQHVNQAVVIVPPALVESTVLKKIPNMVYAVCSGWMQVRGARRWRSADAGFAVSDHADWDGLLTAVKATEAEKVYVTHGQTAAFAKYLNENGMHAVELHTAFGNEEEDEQIPESV